MIKQGVCFFKYSSVRNSNLGGKATVISFSYSGGNSDTDIKNAIYQNWSKFPNGSSLMQFSNDSEIWNGIVNKYDASKGAVLLQGAGTGIVKKYLHNGTLLYTIASSAEAPGLLSGDVYIGIGYIRIGLAANNVTFKWDGTVTKTVNGTVTMQKNIDAL